MRVVVVDRCRIEDVKVREIEAVHHVLACRDLQVVQELHAYHVRREDAAELTPEQRDLLSNWNKLDAADKKLYLELLRSLNGKTKQ